MAAFRSAGCGLCLSKGGGDQNSTCGPSVRPVLSNAKRFHAVQGVSLAIDEGELLVLLGHNGAGKSTTINMLTGILDTSSGDATVFGFSVNFQMAQIRKLMGVCPQHDKLYAKLTGREHLDLFARLKGVPDAQVTPEVNARLSDVLLTASADVTADAYSGGMQRRLSIALALLGDPKIVFLDEPTTGMDPVTRREVWDMIVRAKKGRVILLTTHSMEEADILGDRIAIMAKGLLQALGTSIGLKKEYGGGFRISIFAPDERARDICEWMMQHFPDAAHTDRGVAEGCLLFQAEKSPSASHLAALEGAREQLGIVCFSVGMATLDDVFLNLALKDTGAAGVVLQSKDDRFKEVELVVVEEPVGDNEASLGEATKSQKQRCTYAEKCEACCFSPGTHCCDCYRTEPPEAPRDELDSLDGVEVEAVDGGALDAEAVSDSTKLSRTAVYRKQVVALAIKTMTYQARQRKSLAAIAFFPFVFVLAIALLNGLWLQPMNDRILRNALKRQPELEKDLRYTDRWMPRAWVGLVSDYNFIVHQFSDRKGFWNAFDEKSSKWIDYTLLEQPSYELFVSADANVELGECTTSEFRAWHGNFLDKLRMLHHDFVDATKGSSLYSEWTRGKLDHVFGFSAGLLAAGGADIPTAANASTSFAWPEEAASLVDSSQPATEWAESFLHVWDHINLLNQTALNATHEHSVTRGLLGKFTIQAVAEPLFEPWLNPVLQRMYELLPQTIYCRTSGAGSVSSCNAASASALPVADGTCELAFFDWRLKAANSECDYVPTVSRKRAGFYNGVLEWFCDATVETISLCNSSVSVDDPTFRTMCETFQSLPESTPLLQAVQLGAQAIVANSSASGDPVLAAVSVMPPGSLSGGLCAYHKWRNIEAGLVLTELEDEHAVDDALYEAWFDANARQGGRTPFTAYHFSRADSASHEYAYRAWANFSGAAAPSDGGVRDSVFTCWEAECFNGKRLCDGAVNGHCNPYPDEYSENWMLNIHLANTAILSSAAGIHLEMDLKTFPGVFDTSFANIFGQRFSLMDYFAVIFLPHILVMLMFLITGLIVTEKQERLREIC